MVTIEALLENDCKVLIEAIKQATRIAKARGITYNNEFDEVVNDLFVHLMENGEKRLRSYNEKTSIKAWLSMVVKNLLYDKYSRKGLQYYTFDDHLKDNDKQAYMAVDPESYTLLKQLLSQSRRSMSYKMHIAGILRIVDYTAKEVESMTTFSVPAINKLLFKYRRKVKQLGN